MGNLSLPHLCSILLFIAIMSGISSVLFCSQFERSPMSKNILIQNSTASSTASSMQISNSYQYPSVIYRHIHMAKTGGTSLNGVLANKFERVCGHKGFSYDAYQANERFKKNPYKMYSTPETAELEKNLPPGGFYNRDRVNPDTIEEIGYEDCDYISNEQPYEYWYQFNDFHNTTMELHLPCRDPVDHLMSQCNHRKSQFSCENNSDEEALRNSIEQCLVEMNRFHHKLNELQNINLKCFDVRHQFTKYMDYLSPNLQRRRFVSDYQRRETNPPRVKENECIWKDKVMRERVRSYLVKNIDYYQFCDQCLKSDNNLMWTIQ